MEDKCFCHLNGFRVKDAEARNEIASIKETYATKEYVLENAGGGSGESNVVEYVLPITTTTAVNLGIKGNFAWTNGVANLSGTYLEKLSQIITEAEAKYIAGKSIRLNIIHTYGATKIRASILLGMLGFSGEKAYSYTFYGVSHSSKYTVVISGSWNGEVFTGDSASFKNEALNFLAKNNNIEYIPTGDYNPATKKYVDNSITGASTNGTFTLSTGDVTDGASATWKVTQIGKMCVLDVVATVPTGNELSGCYFTTSSIPLPNGVYGSKTSDIIISVNNTSNNRCELVAFNQSINTATHRFQLIYFVD